MIGAYRADPNDGSSGESYVVFVSSLSFSASIDLSALNGSNGFVLNGIDASDLSGRSVSNAGDVNGDGIEDILIGAYFADPNGGNSGESYVVFGSSVGFSASIELSALNGSNGFVLNGIDASDGSGRSVSHAGDVNGDGIDDILIGAPGNSSGESYVVFGSSAGFSASIELSALNGNNGFVFNGIDVLDFSGRSVSNAGDVNGDGIDDILIGAYGADPNGDFSGESYVVFGRANIVTGNVLINDTDIDNELADFSVNPDIIVGLYGTLTINADGSYTYLLDDSNSTVDALNESDPALEDEFTYTMSDGDKSDTATLTISINGTNDAPLITSSNTVSISENNMAVSTVTSTDSEGDTVTYTITGGADQGLFSIDSLSGALSFDSAPDFEAPGDVGADNVYDVQVTASDGSLNDIQDISITVLDVGGTQSGDGDANNLVGTNDSDVLIGNGGADSLTGGPGDDTLTGGADSDTFIITQDTEYDRITDFTTGSDLVDISAYVNIQAAYDTDNDGTVELSEFAGFQGFDPINNIHAEFDTNTGTLILNDDTTMNDNTIVEFDGGVNIDFADIIFQ